MSSLVRRLQIRMFKKREEPSAMKVPCPYGRTFDTGTITDKGEPILAPVMVWPQFAPKRAEVVAG